jgi:hypothetical protein
MILCLIGSSLYVGCSVVEAILAFQEKRAAKPGGVTRRNATGPLRKAYR